jgi:hypothetical protein
MTAETNDDTRRVPAGARPAPRPTQASAPVDADTDVLPRVGPGAPPPGTRRGPAGPPPGPGPAGPGPAGPGQAGPGPGGPAQVGPRHAGPGPAGPPPAASGPAPARPAPPGRVGHAAAAAVAAATGAPVATPPSPGAPEPTGHDDPTTTAPAAERRGSRRPATDADSGTDEPEAGTERRNGMGAPALVLGLLAAGTCWTGWAGVVLGLFGAAAGYLGARRAWKGLATDGAKSLGGLALGVIGLVVGVIVVWPTLFGTGNFGDGLTLDQCLQQANGAFQMHMCKSQHITEFNQRFPNAAT